MKSGGHMKASGDGIEAILKAAKVVEEQDRIEKKEELAGLVDDDESKEEYALTHDHTYCFPEQIPDTEEEKNSKRVDLQEGFQLLRNQLPLALRNEQSENIVNYNAVWKIAALQREGKELEEELKELKVKNHADKHKLSVLTNELKSWPDMKNVLEAMLELQSGRVDGENVKHRSGMNSITRDKVSSSRRLTFHACLDCPPPLSNNNTRCALSDISNSLLDRDTETVAKHEDRACSGADIG